MRRKFRYFFKCFNHFLSSIFKLQKSKVLEKLKIKWWTNNPAKPVNYSIPIFNTNQTFINQGILS